MARQNYFGGQNGFTPVGNSTRYGNTPGSAALWSFNDNGSTKYFLPSQYAAGNEWSAAAPNADYIKSLGGKQYTTPTYQEVMNRGNPYAIDYNQTKSFGGNQGWVFDSMPDLTSIEQNSQFLPGQGTNNSIWSAGMPGDVAWKIGSAALLGSSLASAAAPTAGASGTAPMSGIGGGYTSVPVGGPSGLEAAGSTWGPMGTPIPSGSVAGAADIVAPAATITPTTGSAAGAGSFMNGIDMGAAGAGAVEGSLGLPGTATVGGSTLGSAASGTSALAGGTAGGGGLMGILNSGLSSLKDAIGGMSGAQKLGAGLGVADLALRYRQSEQLNDIADRVSQESNALEQPQRIPYQNLLTDYYSGAQDLTQQPMIKAAMDRSRAQAEASMAKFGQTGSGNAPQILNDYFQNSWNQNAMPYLSQLSGMAGFGFAPSNGAAYGNIASQATGAPFIGLNSLSDALTRDQNQGIPWWAHAYNSQQQMTGQGPDSSWTMT